MEIQRWFRAYVEQLLAQTWEQCSVTTDDDGDYPYRFGTAACFVRVEEGPPLGVRVVALAAKDVRRTAKLLTELNELNAHARTVSTYWFAGAVYVDKAIDAGGVTADTLGQACVDVGAAADSVGTLLAGMFDGQTPYVASTADEDVA